MTEQVQLTWLFRERRCGAADLTVSLLVKDTETLTSGNGKPLQTWNIVHAYPVKWNVGDFNAEENKIVIETLELSYNYFKIV